MITEILGWIGSACFAACGIPQAWQCYRQGHACGVNDLFLTLWMLGEITYAAAVWMQFGWVWWMMANYLVNFVVISVIIGYRVHDHATGPEV